jgi:hypothetical protein
MPYTGSLAGIGLGSVLSINTGTASTPTWTAVGELRKLNLTGRQAGTADTTNFASAAREFKPTLIASGTWDIEGNRVGGDAGQVAMEAAFVGLAMKQFKIQLPISGAQTTTGDSFTFTALVEELDYSVEVDKVVMLTGKLKVSGVLTETAGS